MVSTTLKISGGQRKEIEDLKVALHEGPLSHQAYVTQSDVIRYSISNLHNQLVKNPSAAATAAGE